MVRKSSCLGFLEKLDPDFIFQKPFTDQDGARGNRLQSHTHTHTHTHIHIHRQIYVCFQRILKAFIWQLNKGFNFKFLALKTKQGLQNSYYDPWHYNTSLAFSKYEPSN